MAEPFEENDPVRICLGQGRSLEEQGQFEEALQLYNECLLQYGEHDWLYHAIGLNLMERELFDQASKAYEHAVALEPAYVMWHSSLANCYDELGLFDKSIAERRFVIQRDPTSVDGLFDYALTLLHAGKIDEAEAMFSDVIQRLMARRSSEDRFLLSGSHYQLGVIAQQRQQFDTFLDQTKRALDFASWDAVERATIHLQIGKALLSLNRLQDAIPHIKRAKVAGITEVRNDAIELLNTTKYST